MHVTWRRPDGFHNSAPADYAVVCIDENTRIWVHSSERDYYPFRISGGWQEEEATRRLNQFVNLLAAPDKDWLHHISKAFDDSMNDKADKFYDDLIAWFDELAAKIKGDKWEVEIVGKVIAAIKARLVKSKPNFIDNIK